MSLIVTAKDIIDRGFNWRDIYYFYKKNWLKIGDIKSFIDYFLQYNNNEELTNFLWVNDNNTYDIEVFLKKKSLLQDISSINIIEYVLVSLYKEDNYQFFLETVEGLWEDFLNPPILERLVPYLPLDQKLIMGDDTYIGENNYHDKITNILNFIRVNKLSSSIKNKELKSSNRDLCARQPFNNNIKKQRP